MQLKVRPIGNSLGVVLPKEALARLNVKDGDVRLTPYDPEFERQMTLAREGMAAYRNTLRELAK